MKKCPLFAYLFFEADTSKQQALGEIPHLCEAL